MANPNNDSKRMFFKPHLIFQLKFSVTYVVKTFEADINQRLDIKQT